MLEIRKGKSLIFGTPNLRNQLFIEHELFPVYMS